MNTSYHQHIFLTYNETQNNAPKIHSVLSDNTLLLVEKFLIFN